MPSLDPNISSIQSGTIDDLNAAGVTVDSLPGGLYFNVSSGAVWVRTNSNVAGLRWLQVAPRQASGTSPHLTNTLQTVTVSPALNLIGATAAAAVYVHQGSSVLIDRVAAVLTPGSVAIAVGPANVDFTRVRAGVSAPVPNSQLSWAIGNPSGTLDSASLIADAVAARTLQPLDILVATCSGTNTAATFASISALLRSID
jgi:hypothetical protein